MWIPGAWKSELADPDGGGEDGDNGGGGKSS